MNFIEFLDPLRPGKIEYLGTFMKGQRGKEPDDLRLLVRDAETREEGLWWLQPRNDFFGRKLSYTISSVGSVLPHNYITPDHIHTHRNYHYYRLRKDVEDVHDFLQRWKDSDPMIPMPSLGPGMQMFLSDIPDYGGRFKFEGVIY